MRILLEREWYTAESTIGVLTYPGGTCFTLEDPVRDTKLAGRTAIPAGVYRVTLTHSPKFGEVLPELHDVQNFTHIRIHAGNTAKDTEGCILVGLTRSENALQHSRLALDALLDRLAEPCWITIYNAHRTTESV